MAQPKGKTGNPNGRPKGTPNKITTELREFICKMLQEQRSMILNDFKSVDAKTRLFFYEKLLQYVLPKRQQQNVSISGDMLQNLNEDELDCIIEHIKGEDNGNIE